MNPALLKLSVATLLALALVGAGYWWGDDAATNRDQAQALIVERAATSALVAAYTRVHDAERQSIFAMDAVSTILQKGSADVIANQKNTISGVRSGAVRLSIPTRADPADAPGAAGAGPGAADGPSRSRLSDEAAVFLTELLSEADQVALELTACQALLVIDRKTVNQVPKEAGQ